MKKSLKLESIHGTESCIASVNSVRHFFAKLFNKTGFPD